MSVEVLHHMVDGGDIGEPKTIAEVAELLGGTAHTLRYYERIGLLIVDRDAEGPDWYTAAPQGRRWLSTGWVGPLANLPRLLAFPTTTPTRSRVS